MQINLNYGKSNLNQLFGHARCCGSRVAMENSLEHCGTAQGRPERPRSQTARDLRHENRH